MLEHIALGVDIGGTNTVFGLVTQSGKLIFESSVPTKLFQEPEQLVAEIYRIVKEVPQVEQLIGIGIGAPNGNAFTGNIEFAPNLEWQGVIPIAALFEAKFQKPSLLANDANAAALGEHLFGNARDLRDFVTITLGTGLGSGIFIDGALVVGHKGFAGEYGHVRVIPDGRICGCGRRGCLETYVSSTGVVRSIHELESDYRNDSVLISLENPDALSVFHAAEAGDRFAQEIIEYTATILGSALADFAAFSNPKAYILFGGIAQNGLPFADKVKRAMEANCLKIYQNDIEIRISSLHDTNAAVLGTAATVFWKTTHA
jgi:glucokinase